MGDITVSILPYSESKLRKVKLAMSIGGKYRVNEIGVAQWVDFANDIDVGADVIRDSLSRILGRLPDAADSVRKAARRDGARHAVLATLTDAIAKRAGALARAL